MHITINKKELEKSFELAANVSAKKVVNPALQGTLLIASQQKLEILSSDSEIFFSIELECETKKEGSVLVKTSLFKDVVKNCSGDTIELDLQDSGIIFVKAIGSRYEVKLHTLSQDEFPPFPSYSDTNDLLSIPGLELKNALSKTIPFASKDDVRFTFNSVYFDKDSIELKILSSDTKRLAFVKQFVSEDTPNFSFLAPIKTAQILKDMLISPNAVSISSNSNLIVFKYDNMVLISNQISGNFPDYKAVIPEETPHVLEIKKESLLSLLKTFSPFYSGESQKLLFSIESGKLVLETEETELGNAHNDIEIDYQGEKVDIAFNYRFVQEIVSIIDEETLSIKILSSNKPVIFKGKEEQNSLFICVPMKL